MPELPEVEVTANDLRRAELRTPIVEIAGRYPCRVFRGCSPDTLAYVLVGRRIQTISRRGKYLLLGLDDGATLLLHRGMSGSLSVRAGSLPSDRYIRLSLTFADGRVLDFNDPRLFGRIAYFESSFAAETFLDERLGREALAPVDGAQLQALFGAHRQAIKLLLLDQHLLAGLGNLYADETLWFARIHPATPGNRVTSDQYATLAVAIPTILNASLERGGTTSVRTHLAAETTQPEEERLLNVYGRSARPCPRCATPIVRIVLGGRGSYFCPTCQPPPNRGLTKNE